MESNILTIDLDGITQIQMEKQMTGISLRIIVDERETAVMYLNRNRHHELLEAAARFYDLETLSK